MSIIGALLGLTLLVATAHAQAPTTTARDPHQVALFRKDHPCPSTSKTTGACPNYVVDHIFPLCAGGPDTPSNMAWQDRAQSYIKDSLERAYCACLKK